MTLLGLGAAAAQVSFDLIKSLWPDAVISLEADGVEAGVIGMITGALDDRAGKVIIRNGLRSFEYLLTAPTNPVPPPILLVPGLIVDFDVDLFRRMMRPRPLEIQSESDLSEFPPPL